MRQCLSGFPSTDPEPIFIYMLSIITGEKNWTMSTNQRLETKQQSLWWKSTLFKTKDKEDEVVQEHNQELLVVLVEICRVCIINLSLTSLSSTAKFWGVWNEMSSGMSTTGCYKMCKFLSCIHTILAPHHSPILVRFGLLRFFPSLDTAEEHWLPRSIWVEKMLGTHVTTCKIKIIMTCCTSILKLCTLTLIT